MWLFRPPGVYWPQADTWLLIETLRTARVGARVLDVGTGTGVLALAAARSGAGRVVAVDRCARAVFAARVNARRARDAGLASRMRTLLGELQEAFAELNQANVVWLGQSLHHVGDQQAALAAATRTLAAGGLLVLLEGGLPARCCLLAAQTVHFAVKEGGGTPAARSVPEAECGGGA